MRNSYKILFLIFSILLANSSIAQKTIKLVLTNNNTNKTTDCDGVGDSDFEFRWFEGGTELTCRYYGGNDGPINDNGITEFYSTTVTSADCWPSGSKNITMRGADNDETLGSCNAGSYCSATFNGTFPAASATANSWHTNNGGVDCDGSAGCDACFGTCTSLRYSNSLEWQISGSYSGSNLDGSGFINNKSCLTAYDFGSTSGTYSRTNQARGCSNSIWYKFTSVNNSSITLTSSAGGTITSYTGSTCAGLTATGLGGTINCPANTTYWFNVAAGSNTDITLTATAIAGVNVVSGAVNNTTCATAYDFGTTPATRSNQFKNCNDIWYKYTPAVNMATITFTSSAGGTVNAYTSCGGASIASGTSPLVLTCPTTQPYWFRVSSGGANTNITVAASLIAGNNVTSAVVNNKTCATAITLTTDATGNLATNQEGRCTNYLWYKYTLTSSKGTLTFDPSASTDVQVYYTTDGVCTGCNVASGTGSATVNDAPAGVYFIRVANNSNGMSLNVSHSGTPSNDNISSARNLGTLTAAGSTLSASDNNNGATQESGELLHPDNENSEETDWLYFTTSNTPPVSVDINLSGSGLDADYRLYYLNDPSYTFPRCNVDWSKLTYVGDGDGDNNANCTVCGTFLSSNRTFNCLLPNTKYYIVVNGFENFSVPIVCNSCSEDNGNYDIIVDPVNQTQAPDNLCSSGTDLGTIAYNGTITKNDFSNYCATRETSEPNSSSSDETVWYKFTTNSIIPTRIDVNVDAQTGSGEGGVCVLGETSFGWVRIYEQTATPCPTNFSSLSDIGINTDITGITQDHRYIECIKPNTTYWIQVEVGGASTCDKAHFNVSIYGNGVLPLGNDRICGVVSNSPTYDVGNAAGIAAKIGTVNADTKTGTTITGTNCYDPNPSWSGICGLSLNDDNDYGVWYKLPAATNRKDVFLKGVSQSANDMDIKFALYNPPTATALSQCNGALASPNNMTLVSGSYYSALGWDPGGAFTCLSPNEDHLYSCLDPAKDYYLMVDASNSLCGTGNFTLNAYYPLEGGSTPCNAEWLPGVTSSTWTAGTHKIDLAANFCGATYTGIPGAPFSYQKPVWWKFVAPVSGSVEIRMKSDSTNLGDELRPKLWVFEENTPGTCSNTALNATSLDQKDPDDLLGAGDPDVLTEILDVRCLVPGRTYYLVTDGANTIAEVCGIGTKVGFFSLEIKDLNQPTRKNDSICGATPGRVAGDPYHFTPTAAWKTVNKEAELTKTNQDNYCFVIQNEPDASHPSWGGAWSTSNNARGGWYSFKAPPSGKVEIELENKSVTSDQIDAQIAVYRIKSGYTCNQVQTLTPTSGTSSPLEFYGSSNDTYAGILADEDLTVTCLMPDSLYYIYIEGINSNTLGINDLATGEFDLTIRSYPQDPAAKNDTKCNPIYLGQPSNTIGSTTNIINAQSCVNFNRNMTIPAGAPTLGTNGVTLTKPTNNHGGVIAISNPPGGNEVSVSVGNIDGISTDYTRSLYPFNNFCASSVGDSVPSTWAGVLGLANGTPRKSVWFMFKAPADLDGDGNEAVLIELNQELTLTNPHSDAIDLRVAVYESSNDNCNGNFYELNSDYQGTITACADGLCDEDIKVTCLEPGRFYWVMVDGAPSNDEGYFGMKISRVTPDPRPSNDYICNAHTLSNSFFTGAAVGRTRDTNICARITRTAIDPTSENDPFGFDLDHTVWYKFTAPTTGVPATGAFAVQVDVNGWGPFPFGYSDKMDPQIAIFESQDNSCNWGTDGANMVEIASEYDILPFSESMKAYCIQPGKTYYIMVDGSPLNSQGFFDISINDITPITIPTNDDLANASALTFPTNIGSGNTTTSALSHNYCTDIQPGELDSWTLYDIDNTVWWKFQVPNSGAYVNQHVDMQIRLRSDPGNTKNDNINLLGAVYHQVAGTAGSPGNTFSNIDDEIGTGTNIAIFSEDINLTCLKPGDWYFIQLDGYSGPFNIFRAQGQGWYDIQLEVTGLTPNQGNDSVCGAITVPVNAVGVNTYYPSTGTYNNICKTTQANENLPWTNADNKTVWFKFVPAASGNVTIEVQSQAADDIDAQIAVYQSQILVAASTCPPVNQLVLVDKDYDALAAGEDLTVRCLDNQYWHYIQVNSANIGLWQEGTFKIRVRDIGGTTNPPYNDNICNARDFGNITNALGTGAFSIVGDSNKCASIQLNEPNTISNPSSDIQKSVWYKFTAPTSGRAKITLHDQDGFLSGIDPEMKLYQGSVTGCPSATPTFSGFTQLESAYNPLPNFPSSTTGDEVIEYECLIPGQVYYIQVDGTTVGGAQGFFDIKIEDMIPFYASSTKKPGNDEPLSATSLTVNNEQCPVPLSATLAGIAVSGDRLQGNGSWLTGNYKKPTISKKDLIGTCNTTDNCGDIWYKFNMPNDACMSGSVVAIQGYSNQAAVGAQYHNDLKVIAYRGTPGSLTPIDCANTDDNALTLDYFHFEVAGTAGETIYLQVFDQNNNDTDNDDEEDFFICVSKRFGADKCQSLNDMPFMEYERDYCWNVEGASGETPASAYGETNSSTNPTENSAYFKFKMTGSPCDSLRISIWQPTPPNLFLLDGSTNSNQIVSLSIYREDNLLCDGSIDGSLVSKSYTCSSPTAILDNGLTFNVGVSNLDTNKTYIIQIDGQGQDVTGYINNGFIRIDTFQRCVNVQAVTYDDTSTGYWRCADGWRYYHDKNNIIIFAMHPNGNNVEGIAKIRYKTIYDEATSCAAQMAEYSMRRIWDYQITSGTIDSLKPVKVRFYYRAAEKTAIINAALAFQGACGGFYEPFEWFKTASGIQYIPTNPAQINPARITAGYSETACLGSPLFGSPSGCFNLTALDNQISCNGTLYVELGAITGFSGGTGAAGVGPWENSSPLPVELTSFTGYNDGDKNVLNWTTASEINTLKFEVERSPQSIGGVFTYIGELPAAGSSNVPLSYHLNDNNPLTGDNYYRLKMIDIDGTFKYSQTIFIRNDKDVVYTNAINGIYPNPTSHLINIDYQSAAISKVEIKILNVVGQEMSVTEMNTLKGNQLLQMDVSSFADGVYIINIRDVTNGTVQQSKFIKD